MPLPRFLLLEDKPRDIEAIQTVLMDGKVDCALVTVDNRADFVTAIETSSFDLILAAYAMPGLDGMAALEIAQNLRPDIPFIFVSASLGEELAIETLKRGATDYVLKQRLWRLVPAVQRALREAQERRDRRQAEAALRESEAEYRTLFESIDQGFCLCEMLFDENGKPNDYRFLKVNSVFAPLTGLQDAVGKTIRELVPNFEAAWVEIYGNVVQTGEPVRVESKSTAMNRWFDVNAFRIGAPQSHQFAVLFTNITDRKRTELNREFLATVTQNLAETVGVDEIVQMVGADLNRYLQISLCVFVEIDEQLNQATINYDWHPSDRSSLVGVYALEEFFTAEHLQMAKAGVPIVIRNYATDPRVLDPSRFAALNIGAEINIPLLRNGKWQFSLAVLHSTPYDWRDDEIELMQELANRIWAKLERARAEEALSESRAELERQVQKFDVTLSTITDYVFSFDRDGRFLYANQVLLDLWGLTAEEEIGKTLAELGYSEATERQLLDNIRRVFETRETIKDETAYTSPTGVEGYFEYFLSPVFAADGTVESVVGCSRNISDRKRIEAELQASQERFRHMADNAPMMVWVTDTTGYCTYLSRSWYDFTGQTEETGLGFGWLDATHPDDRQPSEAIFLAANERQEAFQLEYRLRHRNGHYRMCIDAAKPWFGANGEFKGYIGSVIDIDDRKQAEAALRASEKKYRTLFGSIDEAFCLLEVLFDANDKAYDYRFVEINKAFEQQSGLVAAAGKTILELVPNFEPQWAELYGQVAKSGEAVRFEADVPSMSRIFDAYAFPSGAPDQNLVAVLFNDITERKRREANLVFLAEIQDDCARLTTADAMMPTVSAKIGAYLNLSVCAFIDIDEAQDQAIVAYSWHRADVSNLMGTYRISEFVSEEFYIAARAGAVVIVNDTNTDARTHAENCAALNVQAFIHVPFRRDGQWKFLFNVYDSRPRDWRDDEIELFSELANRILPRLERTRAEAALHASEEQLRLFVTASSDMMYRMSADWSEIYHLTGKNFLASIESPSRTWLEDYIPQAAQSQVLAAIAAAIYTKSPFELEHQVIQLDGTVGWTFSRAIPLLDAQNEIIEWFGAANNITDRKQAEAELYESEARYRLLAEAIPQLVWITDAAGQNEYVNQRFCDYTGLTAEQMRGLNWLSIIHPDDLEITRGRWLGAVNSGQFYEIEYRFRGTDGSYRWFLGQGIPLKDEHGQIRQWFGTCTDIEPQKQIEQARLRLLEQEQTAREQAENANRIKDEFLAVLSHELRSPLNPILGWTRLLQNGKLDAARRAEALKTIERNAKLQTQLIEDLLDISRVMQGKLSLTTTPVSLTFVITAAVETVSLAAEAKGIDIQFDFDDGVAPILGDAARLQQVVWNLLTNAVKFTPNGGQVTIELRQISQVAQIRVIDTGKGINPQFLPHVFEYFRQEDGSTTRKFGGLGLGLAIVRQIVEMHGGTVRAESQGENQGATFVVQLPVMSQTIAIVSEPTHAQAETETALANLQILLVDDETDTREFQAFVLEQSGAAVTAVTSGFEALQALDQFTPDVLVSDVGMAEMDGYMLMRQIRSRPPNQGGTIPAIALTAYAADVDQQKALQAGFQTHLTKPVEPEVLVRTVVILTGKDSDR